MEQAIFLLLEEILVAIVIIGIGFLISWIRQKRSVEQLKIIQMIVEEGVLFAQQVYKELNGEEKFDKALEAISKKLKEKGIKVNAETIKTTIEAVLKRLKKEFGESWDN